MGFKPSRQYEACVQIIMSKIFKSGNFILVCLAVISIAGFRVPEEYVDYNLELSVKAAFVWAVFSLVPCFVFGLPMAILIVLKRWKSTSIQWLGLQWDVGPQSILNTIAIGMLAMGGFFVLSMKWNGEIAALPAIFSLANGIFLAVMSLVITLANCFKNKQRL